ncbi:MAG: type II secretion system protein [Phycisphaerales bacterium]
MHTPRPHTERPRRGFNSVELLAATVCTGILVTLLTPAVAQARRGGTTTASLDNLRVLGTAHVIYSANHNGRQFTVVPDDISAYGNNPHSAYSNYRLQVDPNLRGVILGWGELINGDDIVLHEYRPSVSVTNARLLEPYVFSNNGTILGLGASRFPNMRQFNTYVGGSFYNPVFYSPNDPVVSPLVEPLIDSPFEYVPVANGSPYPYFSSYSLSAAAMFSPDVMRRRSMEREDVVGGWTNPWTIDHGFESPGLFDARHPSLKTHMIEHHWLQNAPENPCNPSFDFPVYGGCEPYYFNHGMASAPATVFYDGSTRLLPTAEAVASDDTIRRQSGGLDGTWSRTTSTGEDGYFSDQAADGTRVSHHMLTADGILGRDTLGPDANRRAPRPLEADPRPAKPRTPDSPIRILDQSAPRD